MPFDQSNEFPYLATLSPLAQGRFPKLLAWLEAGGDDGEYRFDMKWWYMSKRMVRMASGEIGLVADETPACGTVCCIGGYLTGRELMLDQAARLLGMTVEDATALFMPRMWFCSNKYPADRAANTVRHYMKTGEVVW